MEEFYYCKKCKEGFRSSNIDFIKTFDGDEQQPPEFQAICPNCGNDISKEECFECSCGQIVLNKSTKKLWNLEEKRWEEYCEKCYDNLLIDLPELFSVRGDEK